MRKYLSTAILLNLLLVCGAAAQKGEYKALKEARLMGLEYRVKAGFNIGGTSPIPLPREIRAINSYSPTLAIAIEGDVHKRFEDSRWGLLLGMRFESKGMKTNARVKNYHMEMTADAIDVNGNVMSEITATVTGGVNAGTAENPSTSKLTIRLESKADGAMKRLDGIIYQIRATVPEDMQGKVLNEELKHNIKKTVKKTTDKKEAEKTVSDSDISDLISRMTPEQLAALKEKLAEKETAGEGKNE